MTVVSIDGEQVTCCWFQLYSFAEVDGEYVPLHGFQLFRETFPTSSLEVISSEEE